MVPKLQSKKPSSGGQALAYLSELEGLVWINLVSDVEAKITTSIKDSTWLKAYMPSFLVTKAYALAENAPSILCPDSSACHRVVDRSFSSGSVHVFVEYEL